jgi:sulfoxide reductase catalytic subunit YedY
MYLKKKKSWEISESSVTDESYFRNRRSFFSSLGKSALMFSLYPSLSFASYQTTNKLNKKYFLSLPYTSEKLATTYTNFYEFGSSKNIWRRASKLKVDNWSVKIDGLVKKKKKFDIDSLKKLIGLEERIYRFRCVEGWAMVVPWSGFPVKKILEIVDPDKDANYVRFETFYDPKIAPGQKQSWYPWPYIEGISLEEAKNDLAFFATGMYGKDIPNQNGAPLRLVLPWKYGFKSIKSIVKITFTKEKPIGLWEKLAPKEYGFWANVNPNVPHPRWSQSKEQLLGTNKFQETQIYNGYEENVSYLYSSFSKQEKSKLFR